MMPNNIRWPLIAASAYVLTVSLCLFLHLGSFPCFPCLALHPNNIFLWVCSSWDVAEALCGYDFIIMRWKGWWLQAATEEVVLCCGLQLLVLGKINCTVEMPQGIIWLFEQKKEFKRYLWFTLFVCSCDLDVSPIKFRNRWRNFFLKKIYLLFLIKNIFLHQQLSSTV